MKSNCPLVTLIIPCRNEEKYIQACLESILRNDYPRDRLEILIVDGMSEDATRERIRPYLNRGALMRLLDNPKRFIGAAMNRGLAEAKGSVVLKMDAHATYPADYLSRCVQALEKSGAQNVGGRFVICPGRDTVLAKNIALAFAHPFGIGRYYQWMSALQAPTEVQTVSFGCYRKEFLDRYKLLFNENLGRGEDSEFNARLRKEGGRIFLFPDIVLNYYARTTFREIWKHQWNSGFWNLYGTRFGTQLTFRSLVPLTAVSIFSGLILFSFFSPPLWKILGGCLLLYALTSLFYSARLAIQDKNIKSLFLLPIIFGVLQLSFALGSWNAVLLLWRGGNPPWPKSLFSWLFMKRSVRSF